LLTDELLKVAPEEPLGEAEALLVLRMLERIPDYSNSPGRSWCDASSYLTMRTMPANLARV